jgi:hypothetical protein
MIRESRRRLGVSITQATADQWLDTVVADGDGDNKRCVEVYNQWNMARNEIVDSNFESDDSDDDNNNSTLVNTWEDGGNIERKTCKEEMENNIRLIRDFCNGLEYQVQYQDPRFLKTLEREGARFLRLARDCLSREKRLNSSRAASPVTWESSTSNTLFY